MVMNFSLKKVMLAPHRAIHEILKRFFGGMLDYLTNIGTFTECQYGDWFYYPLFTIRKEQ
jgi:hypothetical protein